MPAMGPPHPPLIYRVGSTDAHASVLDRVQRWARATDARIVRRLWPRQAAGAQHARCPGCSGPLPDGMLITLNRLTGAFPAGPAYRALAAGAVEALTPALPLEPGELWCVVCLPCLEDIAAPAAPGRGLAARLQALVDAALRDD